MSRLCWWFFERLSLLLEPDERKAVRGDLQESGESGGRALLELVGLVARRYAAPWTRWQPWAAPLGLAAPFMLLLGGRTVGEPWLGAVAQQVVTLWHYEARYRVGLPMVDDVVNPICICLLMIIWALVGGYAFGLLARPLALVHPVLLAFLLWICGVPIDIMLTHRSPEVLLWLLPVVVLFVFPLLVGVYQGARSRTFGGRRAVLMAVALILLTVIVQIEESRAAVALDVWSRGESMDSRIVWTPQLLPFAAILWQFGLLAAISRWQRRHVRLQTV